MGSFDQRAKTIFMISLKIEISFFKNVLSKLVSGSATQTKQTNYSDVWTVKVAGRFASQLIYICTHTHAHMHTRLKALIFYNLLTESLKTMLVQLPPISFLFQ